MATIAPSVNWDVYGDRSVAIVTWTPVTNADTCTAIDLPAHTDKSVQVTGTFDSASVAVHGSNDASNFAALTSPAGSAIAITTAGIKQVVESTRQVKPVASGGAGSQSLTITLFARLATPLRT